MADKRLYFYRPRRSVQLVTFLILATFFLLFARLELFYGRPVAVKSSLLPFDQWFIEDFSCNTSSFSSSTSKDLNYTNIFTNESSGHINMYGWDADDFCLSTMNDIFWNPLFPHYPSHSEHMNNINDFTPIRKFAIRRFLFFLRPDQDGDYMLKVTLRGGVALHLREFYCDVLDKDMKTLYSLQFNKEHSNILQTGISGAVNLKKKNVYLVDIVHWMKSPGSLKLEWKRSTSNSYELINGTNIYAFTRNLSLDVIMPDYPKQLQSPVNSQIQSDPKLLFYKRVQLNRDDLQLKLPICPYSPSYLVHKPLKLYEGWSKTREARFHPNYGVFQNIPDIVLSSQVADGIAKEVFSAAKASACSSCSFDKLVFVEENNEEVAGKRYFVEIDLVDNIKNQSLRFSDYFYKPDLKGLLCIPQNHNWRKNARINIVFTTSENNRRWSLIMLDTIARILDVTQDRNVHIIMVDYGTKDVDYDYHFKIRNLSYTHIYTTDVFNKVKGFNRGAKAVSNQEEIVLTLDLHLQLPIHFFDEVRKNTLYGKAVYAPVLIRLACGKHIEYTDAGHSEWVWNGFGILAMYKHDWDTIGGMNEKMFGLKWGGEDWEIMDRIVGKQYEVIRRRVPGYYHIHHSRKRSGWYS